MPTIELLHSDKSRICEQVLRDLPEWFGIEQALQQYTLDVVHMDTLIARDADGATMGLIALRQHFPATAEIHVMGVLRRYHRQGVGRQLVTAAADRLGSAGSRFLTVKTLSASRASQEYERTRLFYVALGFQPIEEFSTLWGPANPCLFMLRSL